MSHLSSNSQIKNINNLRTIDSNTVVVQEREFLFRMSYQVDRIYRVDSGCIKLSRYTQDGEKQIIGFYLVGHLIGLDALVDGFSHLVAVIR